MSAWQTAVGALSTERTLVMGILNVTPDSFSDGGRFLDPDRAVEHALALAAAGADIVDIGGQSTRPGASPLSPEEEWTRLAPVLPVIVGRLSVPVSVDTFHPSVARRAVAAGAAILNDVSGDLGNGMLAVAAESGAGIVLTHNAPDKSVSAVADFFGRALQAAEAAGVDRAQVCLDIGVGFGGTRAEDLRLLRQLPTLAAQTNGCPLLVGASRKRVIAAYTGNPPKDDRLSGTLAFHTLAQAGGARVLRVHDVAQAVQAARLTDAYLKGDG